MSDIGDIVYYYEHWSDSIIKARIDEIYEEEVYRKYDRIIASTEDAAKLKTICTVDCNGEEMDRFPGSCSRRLVDLYPSAEAAYDAYYIEQRNKIKMYCEEIKTIEDLVKFPIDHCLNGGEYMEYAAYQAYKIRAKELIGIDL